MELPAGRGQQVPASHLDLLTAPIVGVLTTVTPTGFPHSCLVWVDYDGECARVNTTLERASGRDLLANPMLSLLVVDPENTARYIQFRGLGELQRAGAVAHLDDLTRLYTGHPSFYGHVHPLGQRERETRVVVRVHARRITVDAIHG
ncbi:MAG: pyridoxamine 5'-phosphate oxidase family protein [Kineosporiaceae bacterium]